MSFEERRRQRAGRGGNLAHYSARLLGSDIAARRVCPSSGPSVHGAAEDGGRTREESVGLGGGNAMGNWRTFGGKAQPRSGPVRSSDRTSHSRVESRGLEMNENYFVCFDHETG